MTQYVWTVQNKGILKRLYLLFFLTELAKTKPQPVFQRVTAYVLC